MIRILLLACLLLLIWTFLIEPNMLSVTTLNMKVQGLEGLKVVFVGDLHIKPHQTLRLKSIVKKINQQYPQLVLSIGDFVSGHNPEESLPIEEIAKELSNVKSLYGFYTVLGNHDWWQDGDKTRKVLEKNGIVVLENDNTFININGNKLYIAGFDDMSTRGSDLVKALNGTAHPTILLAHSPDIFPFISNPANYKVTGNVDLTLAGNTHGGQVRIPFYGPVIVPSMYGKRYAMGLIKENAKTLFVTKGIGTSILPIRFNCVPEIVVINFEG